MSLMKTLYGAITSPFRQKSFGSFQMMGWGNLSTDAVQNLQQAVRRMYAGNELVYACVEHTSNAASQTKLNVLNKKTDVPDEEHALRKLLAKPNPYMSEFDFWSSIITLLYLGGRAMFEKERDEMGRVIGLWPMRPDWVTIKPKNNYEVLYHEYGPPGFTPKQFIPDDVLVFEFQDPLNPFITVAPANVAEKVYRIDQSITNFITTFFEKGGMPPGLLKTKQKLLESQVTKLREAWQARYGGYENWTTPAILDADAEFQRIGLTFNEMGFEALDKRDEIRVCMVFQIPPIIVGAGVGLERSTYENYGHARKAWWQEVLLPLFKQLSDEVTLQLLPEFGDENVKLSWDTTTIYALQQDQDLLWRRSGDALSRGGITVNMYLQEIGKIPIGPTGDVFLRPLNSIEVPLKGSMFDTLDDYREPEDEDNSEEQEETDSVSSEDAPDVAEEDEEKAEVPTLKGTAPPDRSKRTGHEKAIRSGVQQFFNEQAVRIAKELEKENA
jgi:HK97 family phage portal protein